MNEAALAREQMVFEQLEQRGIRDPRLLDAMRKVPRERFVDVETSGEAYGDHSLPIGEGQTISQPWIVAHMIQSAAIEPRDRVLEIGAGSGYSAAILGHLANRVWTIERQARLARFSGQRIAMSGLANVTVLRGDGTLGWPPAAPFDAILVTAAAPRVPDPLRRQLAIEGRLVLPTGEEPESQRLTRIVRHGADEFSEEDLGRVAFAPLIGEHGFPEPGAPRRR